MVNFANMVERNEILKFYHYLLKLINYLLS
jgi:hypothetical protein